MVILYAVTVGWSAFLLFSVQPMVGRMVLPLLGGTPSVWSTCMVFFQVMLLAGYVYAHALATIGPPRRQLLVHAAVLLVPLASLPIGIGAGRLAALEGAPPVGWLLGTLVLAAGPPFLALATHGPLLQSWFATGRGGRDSDPYFLFAASNLGSILALVTYPVAIEPWLGLESQARAWAWGYRTLVVLVAACGAATWAGAGGGPVGRRTRDPGGQPHQERSDVGPGGDAATGGARIAPARWARWVVLAFVPSSLMLGATAYVSTDIAPAPLLWVVPLALYLLSFVVAFARGEPAWQRPMARLLDGLSVVACLTLFLGASQPLWIPLHLGLLLAAATVCHGQLARDRPPPQALTRFYLAVCAGGALGGVANGIVAPLVFDRLLEYPLAILLSVLVSPGPLGGAAPRPRWPTDLTWALAVGGATVGIMACVRAFALDGSHPLVRFAVGVPALAAYTTSIHRRRFALSLAAFLVVGGLHVGARYTVVASARSFFAVSRVTQDLEGRFHMLIHGGTVHGTQSLDPARRREPLAYYHPTGPAGDVMGALAARPGPVSIAVVGLGAGAMAAYATAGQDWTFYEIDPTVVRIARDPALFTYLSGCRARRLDVVLGDARVRLAGAGPGAYDLIVLDAFGSDAIPIHLLTREAMGLYLSRLAPRGIVALHVSSLYADLSPIVAGMALATGTIGRTRSDPADAPSLEGKSVSEWAVLTRTEADLGSLAQDPRWQSLPGPDRAVIWTDDHASILGLLAWR